MTSVPPGAISCCTDCSGELIFDGSAREYDWQVTGTPTGGTYTLDFSGTSVGPIAYNANATGVNAALVTAGVPWTATGSYPNLAVTTTDPAAITLPVLVTLAANGLTGGTAPDVNISEIADGVVGFTMHRQAWCLTDLSSLWEVPNQRGANVFIPFVPGRYPTGRLDDETDYALPFIVSGVVDENDNPATDENSQLQLNLALLRSTIFQPAQAGTIAATLISPDTSLTLTADVQFGPQPLVPKKRSSGIWVGTLHLVIPLGAFA